MATDVEYPMRADSIFPREDIERAERMTEKMSTLKEPDEPSEIGMAEESEESIRARLQRAQDQINVIGLILHYKNYVSEEEKLRQIRVVVE